MCHDFGEESFLVFLLKTAPPSQVHWLGGTVDVPQSGHICVCVCIYKIHNTHCYLLTFSSLRPSL